MATSYKVQSMHLDLNRYSPKPQKIAPKDLKAPASQHSIPVNVSSYGYGESRPHFEKDAVVDRTANNVFAYSYDNLERYGRLFGNDGHGHGHWKSAGEDVNPAMFSPIPKMPYFGLIVGPRLGMYFPDKRDTQVDLQTSHEIVNALDPNKIGYAYSKIGNMEETFRSMHPGNENYSEAAAWIDFLAKKGISIDTSRNPNIIGLGAQEGESLAAHYPQGYLVRETDFHNRARMLISRYGLTDSEAVEAMKRAVMLHEFAHVLGVKGDDKSEALQGWLQAEFYSNMADNVKGTRLERIYRALANEGGDYARWYSKSRIFRKWNKEESGDRTIDAIIHKFEAEADALGLSEEESREYVTIRVYDTYGALLDGKPSHNKSKTRNRKHTSKKESLEEKIDGEENFKGNLKLVKGGKYSEYKDKPRRTYDSEELSKEAQDKESPSEEPASEAA